jgi:hypothetical protein
MHHALNQIEAPPDVHRLNLSVSSISLHHVPTVTQIASPVKAILPVNRYFLGKPHNKPSVSR